jgi:hypothetical protein
MIARRIIVRDAVHDAFVGCFVERVRDLKAGDPADPGTAIGPAIQRRQFDTSGATFRELHLLFDKHHQPLALAQDVVEESHIARAPGRGRRRRRQQRSRRRRAPRGAGCTTMAPAFGAVAHVGRRVSADGGFAGGAQREYCAGFVHTFAAWIQRHTPPPT